MFLPWTLNARVLAAGERSGPVLSAHDSLVHACIEYLALHGIKGYAINQVSHHGKDGVWRTPGAPIGFPDVVACYHGQFIALEAKTGKSKPRPDQVNTLADLVAAGATVLVVTSVDQLEPLVQKLRRTP